MLRIAEKASCLACDALLSFWFRLTSGERNAASSGGSRGGLGGGGETD